MKRFLLGGMMVLALMVGVAPIANAGVDDFYISSFEADYYLGRDSDGRSTLKTVEQITAEFPNFDQNHGLERTIPKSYDGHSTSLDIVSVTDDTGAALKYSTMSIGNSLILRIGDADKYVYGSQLYKITYQQRDVTKYFADVDRDEWYWDTNGTQWRVPTIKYQTRVHVDDQLMSAATGDRACYRGMQGATDRCNMVELQNGAWQVTAVGLVENENITLAYGFAPNTFAQYQRSLWDNLVLGWMILTAATAVVAVIVSSWLGVRWYRQSRRTREIGTIVPEYLPPANVSVTAAATLANVRGSVFAAQLVDLAVRHYIRIYQTSEKTLFKKPNYEIEIIKDTSTLLAEEVEILKDMFVGETTVGQRLDLKTLQSNTFYYRRTLDNNSKLKKLIRTTYDLRAKNEQAKRWYMRTGVVLLVCSLVLLSIPLLVAAGMTFVLGFLLWPVTDKGLALTRYLRGLKQYIKVAETDRLKMLQSPEGAEKTGVTLTSGDTVQLVKLYERVLPYAVLFGQEKEWTKQLGVYYEAGAGQPDWYVGSNTFNAIAFSSAISSFTTAASYSSSSGGSGGGGSSGGGGGGGGGGGW